MFPQAFAAMPKNLDAKTAKLLSDKQVRVNYALAALYADPKLKINVATNAKGNIKVTVGVPCAPNNCLRDVNATQKAIALATLLPSFLDAYFQDGRTSVEVKLGARVIAPKDLPTTQPQAVAMIKHALRDNTLFVKVVEAEATEDTEALVQVVTQAKFVQVITESPYDYNGVYYATASQLLSYVYGFGWLWLDNGAWVYTTTIAPAEGC